MDFAGDYVVDGSYFFFNSVVNGEPTKIRGQVLASVFEILH